MIDPNAAFDAYFAARVALEVFGVDEFEHVEDHRGVVWAVASATQCGKREDREESYEGAWPRRRYVLTLGEDQVPQADSVREVRRHGEVSVLLDWNGESSSACIFTSVLEIPADSWATILRDNREPWEVSLAEFDAKESKDSAAVDAVICVPQETGCTSEAATTGAATEAT